MERLASNFRFLEVHDPQLVRLGLLAEKYFPDDPNTCLLKLRQLAELLAQLMAARVGLFIAPEEGQYELLGRLRDSGVLPRDVAQLFGEVRRTGNEANHQFAGDHRTALNVLRITWQLALWYHRTFAERDYRSGPFIPPKAPADEGAELKAQLAAQEKALAEYQQSHQATAAELQAAQAKLAAAQTDQHVWEQLATDTEQANAALAAKLELLQAQAAAASATPIATVAAAASKAATYVELDEPATRELIDAQLRAAGWEADSKGLTYAKGARPEKGANRAIAEWPTKSGPADYILFLGLTPVATVEAKRKSVDVAGALQQATRYSEDLTQVGDCTSPGGPWGKHQVPFIFSTNGRPYLKQIAAKSGIWFRDVRRKTNHARPLDGWYSPEGLVAALKQDVDQSETKLKNEGFEYGFHVRPYQKTAIQAVEQGVAEGQRSMLLAMATGTGKTKTCIALIYRLLKTQRFNRVLFLVDRTALGEQAANAFKETRMENLNVFADVFGIKELVDQDPDTATKVHIATVQSMVQRLAAPDAADEPIPVDRYDCIIIDECHRGYLLDRELSDTELGFRGFEDYVSKYRRVIEYFDAVKVGLTATPALHTVEIFGRPVFNYSYREAVLDGYLVDHEPPIRIKTELSTQGIKWRVGEEVARYNPETQQVELFNTPDELNFDIDDFNRKVLTESFNRVVCQEVAKEIDPNAKQKTLIFCATDLHADMVVNLLKKALQDKYGEVDDEAVVKITGAADKPLSLIRKFKNETLPNIAVTVDLLTTGIDVPEICNLVFLRRVNSRILFDQMLGRATRLCPDIGKETFRIFDPVGQYEALKGLTAMAPVVVNPGISFTTLMKELASVDHGDQQAVVLEQFIAKLQRKKRRLDDKDKGDFEAVCGLPPETFIAKLREMKPADVAAWFTQNPGLGEILDRTKAGPGQAVLISGHDDKVTSVTRGYGDGKPPQAYLDEFTAFIKNSGNQIPALTAVLKRPRELTRKELKLLLAALDAAGYSESSLTSAWRDVTNQEIAARILGFIRAAALGDPLVPYEERVAKAVQKIEAKHKLSKPQRDWLKVIAEQTKANLLVDRAALDEPDLIFRRDGGGFSKLNKLFEGKLEQVLDEFNEALWPPAA
jgi:type I restriction enzyme, R subunit